MVRLLSMVCAAVLALALNACATAADYVPLMTSFSEATGKAQLALETYDMAAAQRFTQLRRQQAIARPVGVQPPPGDCETAAMRCRIFLYEMQNDPAPAPLTIESLAPNHIAAMRAVAAYAKALQDVAQADATPAIKTAADRAGAAIAGLSAVISPGAAAAITPFLAPVSKALVFSYSKYQEQMKLDALRHASAAMAPVLNDAVRRFGTIARYVSTADLTRLVADLDTQRAAFEQTPAEASLQSLLASAVRLDQALAVRPQDVFANLGAAHDELTRALNGSADVSWQTAFQRIDRLASDAEALQSIAAGFLAAANMR